MDKKNIIIMGISAGLAVISCSSFAHLIWVENHPETLGFFIPNTIKKFIDDGDVCSYVLVGDIVWNVPSQSRKDFVDDAQLIKNYIKDYVI